MNKLTRSILVTIFLFLVAGLSIGFVKNFKKEQQNSSLKIAKEEKGIEWGSYINEDYGYSLIYPKGWEKQEWNIKDAANLVSVPNGSIWQQAVFESEDGRFEILVWENSGGAPVRSWISWFRHEDLELSQVPTESNITISNTPAISYVQQITSRKKPLQYIFLGNGTRVYELVFERDDFVSDNGQLPVHKIYDEVISEFKLLAPLPHS